MTAAPIRWCRSILLVPGHKLDWMRKAEGYGADALLFDLEDPVPLAAKADARAAAATAVAESAGGPRLHLVRVNGWRTGHLLADLDAVVVTGLDGVALAKTDDPAEVRSLDLVLTELELARGLEPGSIEIYPVMETAHGMRLAHEIFTSSPRVRRAGGVLGSMPGGDYYRAMGSEWSDDGIEALFINCKMVLDARAAGLANVIAGTCAAIDDDDALRRTLLRVRQLGANGALAVHPAQVPVINEVFSPRSEDVDAARRVLETMAVAIAGGDAAARHEGRMVDYAHVRTALDVLGRAEAFGLDVGQYPHIDLPREAEVGRGG